MLLAYVEEGQILEDLQVTHVSPEREYHISSPLKSRTFEFLETGPD
jgi:hypothetical protein